ncbi:MAG: glycosyltransferase family 39 protein, partial [Actinobacteria bacterium]
MHPTASNPPGERPRAWAALLAIVLLAAVVRWCFFVGFGVTGDDIIYAGMSNELARRGWAAVDLRYGVNYRLGLSVPLALLFRAAGINDLTYVIYPLLMSLVSIVVVFLLGRRLFGTAAGLTAALLVATCPFDAVFASSMTIDIITSCLMAITVLTFLAAREVSGARCFAHALLGAAATLVAYMIKEPALYVLPCLGAFTLTRIRDRGVVLRDAVFYGVVGASLAATFAADYWATGDALNRLHVQLPQSGSATGPISDILLEYPRWVWLR